MNKELYKAKRAELLTSMKALLDENKVTEAIEIRKQIEKLDKDYEDKAKEMANFNALNELKIPAAAPVTPVAAAPVNEPEAAEKVYAAAFAKFMMGQTLSQGEQATFDKINTHTAAMTEADHSVLVPHTLRAGIWEEIGKAHPILRRLAKTFINGDVDIIVEKDSGEDATWYDEATTVADGTTDQGTITLKGYELAKSIPVSWKLKKMAVNEFMAYIAKKLADKMANALAAAVMAGKGVPASGDNSFKAQPKGIQVALAAETNTPQILTYTAANGIKYTDLTSLMSKVKSGYLRNAEIYATNTTIWTQLANITDTTGKPMFIPDVINGTVGKLFGIPVYEEDAVVDGDVVLADVQDGYAMNVNEDVSMYFEDHIKPRTTDYMAYSLIDGMPLTTKAFAWLKKSA